MKKIKKILLLFILAAIGCWSFFSYINYSKAVQVQIDGAIDATNNFYDNAETFESVANALVFEILLGTNAIGGDGDVMEWTAIRSLQF